jgi:hypothetical protein
MPDFAVPAVKVLGVGLLQSLHEFGKRRGTGLKQQVDVIGHQAIGVDPHLELGAVFLQPLEVGSVILIVSKGLAPLVTPDDDVIEQPRCKHSWTPGHGKALSKLT